MAWVRSWGQCWWYCFVFEIVKGIWHAISVWKGVLGEKGTDGKVRTIEVEYQNHNEGVKRTTVRGVRDVVIIYRVDELSSEDNLYFLCSLRTDCFEWMSYVDNSICVMSYKIYTGCRLKNTVVSVVVCSFVEFSCSVCLSGLCRWCRSVPAMSASFVQPLLPLANGVSSSSC